MLRTARQFDELVRAVPADLRFPRLRLPSALSEIEALRTLGALAERNADATRYLLDAAVSRPTKASNQPVLVVSFGYIPKPCPPCS